MYLNEMFYILKRDTSVRTLCVNPRDAGEGIKEAGRCLADTIADHEKQLDFILASCKGLKGCEFLL